MLGGFERRVFQSEGLLITSEKSLWLRRSPRRSSTFLLQLFCFVALSPQRLAVWYWTLKRWDETSNAIAPAHLTEKVTWHCQIEGYEMYGSNNQENSRSWVCINSFELLAVVGCLVIWFGLGCLQVIEGYMSVGAVYVVVVAGASLALFACLGIYAVRQGPGASLDWEVPAGEKNDFWLHGWQYTTPISLWYDSERGFAAVTGRWKEYVFWVLHIQRICLAGFECSHVNVFLIWHL